MNKFRKYILSGLVVLGLIGGTAGALLAAHGARDGRCGAGGEITTIEGESITVVGRHDEERTLTVSDETVITFVETQSEGRLADLEVGDTIRVRGQRNDEGTLETTEIHVAPDGDHVGGRVTAVEGTTLTVENREGDVTTITTDDDTQFRNRDESANLADIATGQHLKAFGTLEDDGSFSAGIVFLEEGRGGGRH